MLKLILVFANKNTLFMFVNVNSRTHFCSCWLLQDPFLQLLVVAAFVAVVAVAAVAVVGCCSCYLCSLL